MNLFNMINSRVVVDAETKPIDMFRTLFDGRTFWIVFFMELLVQHGFVLTGAIPPESPLSFMTNLFSSCNLNWKIHLTAWMFGMFVIPLRLLTNRLNPDLFRFMEGLDLESR